jgi:hypothetical protein
MASKVEIVVITPANFDKLKKDKVVLKSTMSALDDYGRQITYYAKKNAPVDRGEFRSGLDYTVNNSGELKLVWNRPASRPRQLLDWILYGTGIYGPRHTPVVPKRAKFLVFKTKDGRWHKKKSVRGMKPDNFVKEAWSDTERMRRTLAGKVGRLVVDAMTTGRGKGSPVVPTRK